ncbi:MAG: hypothetical protein HPY71_13595 [Firmicutes bacterium]|nr:hypothetical protein [Bacillota bacterium]
MSRAQAWDAELDRRKRQAQADEVEEMEKRHAQLARNALSVIGAVVGLFGKRVQDDRLAEMSDDELAELVTKALRNASEIADLERKSRGLPTEINEQRGTLQVTGKYEHEATQRIIADPEARELARRLYSRLDSKPKGSG